MQAEEITVPPPDATSIDPQASVQAPLPPLPLQTQLQAPLVAPPPPPLPPVAPTLRKTVYAIRKGKGITKGIFLSIDDCKEFIDDGEAVYSTFNNIHDALAYLNGRSVDSERNLEQPTFETTDAASTAAATSLAATSTFNSAPDESMPGHHAISTSSATKVTLVTPLSNQTKNRVKAEKNPKRRPTKAWERMFNRFKAHVEQTGSTVVQCTHDQGLLKWIKQQEIEYKNLLDGKGSSMFQDKIDLLENVGFKFTYVSIKDRYASLFKYKEEHGHYNHNDPMIDKWIEKQRVVAKKFVKGDSAAYFDMRLKEFTALGIHISFVSEDANMTKDERLARDHDVNWDKYFDHIIEYKRKHGNMLITQEDNSSLYHWVQRQHQEYQKIQGGKSSQLTVERVQKLTDAGFVFQQRKQSIKWMERLKQLGRYKEKHGHVRVPKSDPELGVFVNRQRYEYTKLMAGKPSSLNTERLDELKALDFVFQAGKKPKCTEKKPWEERYQELVLFKEEHGHVMVPQNTPGLGEWVHSQRAYYKKLKQGKSSPLSPERLLMLANLGFVFDATRKRGQHFHSKKLLATPEPAAAIDHGSIQVPQLPTPLTQHAGMSAIRVPVLQQNQLTETANIGHLVTAMQAPTIPLHQFQGLNNASNGLGFEQSNATNPNENNQENELHL